MKEDIYSQKLKPENFISFVWPSILMMLVLALYYTIDSIFVSNFVGETALAALNIAYPVQGIMWGLAVMLAAGSSTLVGIEMGKNHNKKASSLFSFSNAACFAIGCIFTILIFIFLNPIIDFLGATDSLTKGCREFLSIFILGMPFAFTGTHMEYFVRADGSPKFTILLYLCGGIVHLGLDILLMGFLNMGLAGAAFANVCGLLATALLGISYFIFKDTRLKFCRFKIELKFLWKSIINGSPEFVNESAMGILVFFANLIMIGLAGETGVAASAIVLNLFYFFLSIHIGFSTGVLPLLSYYYGAGRTDNINKVIRYSKFFIIITSAIMALIVACFAGKIVMVYEMPGSSLYDISVYGLRISSIGLLISGFNIYASTFFTAFGKGLVSSLISLSRGFVVLLLALIICAKLFGLSGVWFAIPLSEMLTLVLSFYVMVRYKGELGYDILV